MSDRSLRILQQLTQPLDAALEAVTRSWITLALRDKVFDELVEDAENQFGPDYAGELERIAMEAAHNRMVPLSDMRRGSSSLIVIPLVIQTESEISGGDDYLSLPSPEAFARAVRKCGWVAPEQHVAFCAHLFRYADLVDWPAQQMFDLHDAMIASAETGSRFEFTRREEVCGYRIGNRSIVLRFAVGTIFVDDAMPIQRVYPSDTAAAERALARHLHLQMWSDRVANQFVTAFGPQALKEATAIGETEVMGAVLKALSNTIHRDDATVLEVTVTPDQIHDRLLFKVTWAREVHGDWAEEPKSATVPIQAATAPDLMRAAEDVVDYFDSLRGLPSDVATIARGGVTLHTTSHRTLH